MYVDRSLRCDPMKERLIDELNFKNCLRLKRKKTRNFFVGITSKKIRFIIHPGFFDANNIFSDPFIQNLKRKPNMVHDLSRQIKISLKKQRLDNSVKHQIHQILRITSKNGKTEYYGRTYAKNDVVLEPGCIRDAFELREP